MVELDLISEAISTRMEEENNKRFAKLEENLRVMQGYKANEIEDFSRYVGMNFPDKFKVLEFTKYDGTADP